MNPLPEHDKPGVDLRDAARAIEDKYLERGIFSKYFDEDFELSVNIKSLAESEGQFSIEICFETEGSSDLDDSIAEELSDMVEDDYFAFFSEILNAEEMDELRLKYCGKSVYLNGESIY